MGPYNISFSWVVAFPSVCILGAPEAPPPPTSTGGRACWSLTSETFRLRGLLSATSCHSRQPAAEGNQTGVVGTPWPAAAGGLSLEDRVPGGGGVGRKEAGGGKLRQRKAAIKPAACL